jgi:hypothetical protein
MALAFMAGFEQNHERWWNGCVYHWMQKWMDFTISVQNTFEFWSLLMLHCFGQLL